MKLIRDTKSVCPDCLQTIDAQLFAQDNEVVLYKKCSEHGEFQTVVWRGEPSFNTWENTFSHKINPDEKHLQPLGFATQKSCPHKCGLCSEHEQSTCTVLFELGDACNLSCPICFANSQDKKNNKFEELASIANKLKWIREQAGSVILQLSGGEPTLHPNLCEIIKEGTALFPAVQLNTNGILLGKDKDFAVRLKKSGLSWVFLQFDTLNDEANVVMRGARLLEIKKKAIEHCKSAGLSIVLVCTIANKVNDSELGELLDFSLSHFPAVKGLHFQPMTLSGRNVMENQKHITLPEVIAKLAEQSNGSVKIEHALASDCEHILCSFHARYFVDENKHLDYIRKDKACTSQECEEKRESLIQNAPQRSVESVIRSWEGSKEVEQETNELSGHNAFKAFDDFIKKSKSETFSITCMVFQDCYTLDLLRLKQCCIHIYSFDKVHRLIPFCAYNLTSRHGDSLYR